ncbi:MAG: gliding motility-associated ABC transporter substrate-binding protein GldG [Dysgonomonas sp.]|nr:gliding motility-associated ABC transporter substrate-binding protein GldG [Dysgonomonas sp.]
MKALVFKELKSVFCSPAGAFFAFAFLLISGLMLWTFSGNYNLIDSGYAEMKNFFAISPILLSVLIPALTMRLFAEEKRNKTLDTLLSRPVHIIAIYFSKFLTTLIFVFVTILPTIVYVYSLYQLANPVGNIDLGSITASYTSIMLIAAVFIAVGLFSSAITNNQIVALIISIFISLFIYYGFDLISMLFLSGETHLTLSSLGLLFHCKLMQRGVIQVHDLIPIFNYILIFVYAAILILNNRQKSKIVSAIAAIIVVLIINFALSYIPNYRLDYTIDKRYTLSDYSKKILEQSATEKPYEVTIYLNGELNYGFQYLRNATIDLLNDFNNYTPQLIDIKYVNPYQSTSDNLASLQEAFQTRGIGGITLNEIDREGKMSRKIIYPYAQITNHQDTLFVPLLKNIAVNTADENLNASAESLEFEFIDAIRLLNQKTPKSIAFIEGHDELSRAYVYDAEELLSKYYTVNRGQIGSEIDILNEFDAIIIAGPLKKYTEAEKYIIDQYIMKGGKVLWLIDGVYYSHQELARVGHSASIKNDVNLDDLLFNYGIRINPELIQDKQSVSTYVMTDDGQSLLIPSYYQPLLIPSLDNPITKNIMDVKAGFASSVDFVNNSSDTKKEVLLTTSANTHLVKVPDLIDFDIERIQDITDYFNQSFLPVAVSLEGVFRSAYINRMIPDSVITSNKTVMESKPTKMIAVASSEIISNEIQGQRQNSQPLPMGYNRASNQQFGNRDFIVNAVNWLTDEDGLMALRAKKQQMHILNKKEAYENRNKYAVLNVGFPILFILLIMGGAILYRKQKYEK